MRVLGFFVVILCLNFASAGSFCGKNAAYVQCPNPCPGGTCGQPEFSPCKRACINWGCQCKKGFVRDATYNCMKFSECPKNTCKDQNEIYNECGTACPPTCANLQPICVFTCNRGCFCRPGYVRDSNGVCIPLANCPV
jgi:Trypsin Inhibitor like cysteine rich domain